jgi:Protein of unknown function (DUF2844)
VKSPVHSHNGHLAATPRVVSRFVLPLLASLVAAFAAAPAHAVLGGAPMATPNGATANGAVSRAAVVPGGASGSQTAAASSAPSYSVSSTTLASGTVVNEYVSAAGVVFGIAWQGRQMPDLPNLLGSYFPHYLQALKAQRAARGSRGPVSVEDSGLIVQSGGHMGSFAGKAYLQDALPAGVSASDIQ